MTTPLTADALTAFAVACRKALPRRERRKRRTHVRAGSTAHQLLLAALDQQEETQTRRAIYSARAKVSLSNEIKRLRSEGLIAKHFHITDAGREVLARVVQPKEGQT